MVNKICLQCKHWCQSLGTAYASHTPEMAAICINDDSENNGEYVLQSQTCPEFEPIDKHRTDLAINAGMGV
jgi:hypothetical protein